MRLAKFLKWDEILKPGTPFWTISFFQKQKEVKCPICKGKGYVKLEGNEYDCPECFGKGFKLEQEPYRWHIKTKWCTDYWVVTRTEINQTDEAGLYKVMYWDECNGFPAEKVFTSKREASKRVNALNAEIEK